MWVPSNLPQILFILWYAFFIAFMKVGTGKPNIDKFAFIHRIKALAKHKGFWYTTKRGTDMKGIIGIRDNMGH